MVKNMNKIKGISTHVIAHDGVKMHLRFTIPGRKEK